MRQFFPVEELARDERFHTDHDPRAHGRPAHGRSTTPAEQPTRNNNRLTPVAQATPATRPGR